MGPSSQNTYSHEWKNLVIIMLIQHKDRFLALKIKRRIKENERECRGIIPTFLLPFSSFRFATVLIEFNKLENIKMVQAKAPRTVAKFHFFKRCKVLEN